MHMMQLAIPQLVEIMKQSIFSLIFLLVARSIFVGARSPHATIVGRGGGLNDSILAPVRSIVNTVKESKRHLTAAAVARCTSIFIMYPVDTIKTRTQMSQGNVFRLTGLYSGVGGSLVGQVPYGVLTFGSYEMYKEGLISKFPKVKPFFLYAVAAVLGDLTGSGWLCPSEVVKQQMQAGMYSSTGEALRAIWAKNGIAGFYQGYSGALARDVPFRVAQLTSYEVTKNFYLRMKRASKGDDKAELSPGESAICGAVSGTFSSAITCPLDRIKTLLMTNGAVYGGSVGSCVSKIWAEEGISGFTQGMVPRIALIAPSVAIFFIVYERVQQRMK